MEHNESDEEHTKREKPTVLNFYKEEMERALNNPGLKDFTQPNMVADSMKDTERLKQMAQVFEESKHGIKKSELLELIEF